MRKRKRYWFLTGVFVFFLCFFLRCPELTWAMRTGNMEKQQIMNSFNGEYQIDFSYGFQGKYQDSNHVPVEVEILNQSSNELEGFFVFDVKASMESVFDTSKGMEILSKLFPGIGQTGDGRNSHFIYRFPIRVPAGGSIKKEFFSSFVSGGNTYCTLSLENSRKDTIYSQKEIVSGDDFFLSALNVCVVEEETTYGQQLNGMMLSDHSYEISSRSVTADEISERMVESYTPDILILLEQNLTDLSEEQQKVIENWKAEGGLLLEFSGTDTFVESQRTLFKEDPAGFLRQVVDEDTAGRILIQRNAKYQKYYMISDLLENTKIRNHPNIAVYAGILLFYIILAGPGLYFFLKKRGKREFLWESICLCSFAFLIIVNFCAQNTKVKAPVLTYLREVWQYENYTREELNFCAQAPFHTDYEIYLDPSYDLVTYHQMDFVSSGTEEPEVDADIDYEQTELYFSEQKNKAKISNMPAFSMNAFSMQKKEERKEAEGLRYEFSMFEDQIDGFVENKTEYDLKNCVLVMPGSCVLLGDLAQGEKIVLERKEVIRTRETAEFMGGESLPDAEKNYLTNLLYNYMPNRQDNCLLLAKIQEDDTGFQLDSGYEAYGISYYLTKAAVKMEQNGIQYCSYAQEYQAEDGFDLDYQTGPGTGGISEKQEEITYYLNCIFEKNNVWKEYQSYASEKMQENSEGILAPDYWKRLVEQNSDLISETEAGNGIARGVIQSIRFAEPQRTEGSEIRNFDGRIELYNYQTGLYEELPTREVDFTQSPIFSEKYVNASCQIKVRYTISDEEFAGEYFKKRGFYEPPDLIVKASKIPIEEYLAAFEEHVEE